MSRTDSKSRLILFKAVIKEETYTIANIYGPNKDADAVKFYQNLANLLRNNDFGNEENIIMGGDFNCPLNITLDKKKRWHSDSSKVCIIKSIEHIQDEFSLHDIWRKKNPNQQAFQETVKHQFFFQCAHSKKFWNHFENFWLSRTKKQRKLYYKSIIIGVLDCCDSLHEGLSGDWWPHGMEAD